MEAGVFVFMERKPIGKRLRFEIFARDGFTCRYCGRQSDTVILHIDHIHPVCQGGTNDPSNLITSCVDCNLGKAGKKIDQHVPSESSRLSMAQDLREQAQLASLAIDAAKATTQKRSMMIAFWNDQTGRELYDKTTIQTIFSYVQEYGESVVYGWIEKAAFNCPTDTRMGKYISGIRRAVKAETQDDA